MAKNNSKGQDSKNSSASPKKTAWRGINLKQKSPSRPASVNSQESRKSTHTITSIEKSTEVSSPLSTEFEVSSPTSTEQQQSSSVEVDAIEKDTNKKATTTTKKTAKSTSIIGDIVSSSPAPAKTATSNTATITTTTTETTSTVAETQKEDAKEEDDGASTPRAGSRRSSFSALDSASEVFEDAFDDHDDYFDDDVPTFDEQSTEKDQIDSALSALSNKNTNDEEHDNVTREEERREKRRATVDEVEGLQISEASSHSPIQAKQEKQLPKDVDNSSENILKKEATSSAIASTFTAAEEAAAAAAAFADGGDNVPTVTTSEESGLEEEPIKMAQPTVLRDNDVTQGNAQLVKETQEHETLLYQEKKEDLAINDITSTVTTDIPLTEPKEPERQSSSNGQQQINGHSNITSVCHEQEEYNHRVVDVLADLENSVSNLQQRYEFPTVNIDTARGGGTSEKSPVEHADSGVFDAKSSEEKSEPTRNTSFSDSVDRKELEMDQHDHLGNLLPAMEDAARETMAAHDRIKVNVDNVNITPEDQSRAARSHEFEHPIEDPIDLDMFRDNVISIPTIDPKSIPINYLSPREQEEADEPVREGMRNLFDNKFMKAKNAFQSKANVEPLYALGLGAMAFIKAMMTYQGTDVDVAMSTLASAYTIAKAQIDNTAFKKPLKEAVSQYFSSMLNRNGSSNLPSNPAPITRTNSDGQPKELPTFLPNSILRAHVIKAECCLLMSILQLSQESVVSYLKCGLNLRRAYNSYSIVWQEYKRMGQNFTKYMDRDTVSAIQFGIGAVHLILSSMPQKILKIFSTLGWQSDKQLGFALLKLCLEGRGIRSPLASLTLLSYYSVLTSFAPQIYAKELMGPAIECLLDAQKAHPSSCFFLFFAARIARVARNIPLSTQSFSFAVESSRGEWAETAMKQMADYEIGFNLALQLDWEGAAAYFEQLSRERYWSPAFSRYFVGACREMLGQRTECILAFAEVPQLAKDQQSHKTYIESHVQKKVEFFQKSGYQDMDFSLPGLEILLVWNAFEQMEPENLEKCLDLVHQTLEMIYEREKMEYTIRLRELVPSSTPPDYYDQRAVLLLTKASLLNALGRYNEGIAHLNWVMDHKDCIKHETWAVPFAYWEAGVTSWGLGNIKKSRKLWQMALSCNKYDFEYRMAVRLSLALARCDEIGVPFVEPQQPKGQTTNGRKRMPITDP